jgi:acyl-homoserine lactone synthase
MIVIAKKGFSGARDDRTLRAMFEDRKSIFVDLLQWDVPVLEGRFEIDQFDTPAATYVIVADEARDHLGSARLLPTMRPHILGGMFAGLCAAPPPTGANIFEITRFCLSRRQDRLSRRATRNALVSALVSHALEAGIETYTAVAEMAWLQQILAFGWNCRPLGPPARFDCGTIGALAIEITPDTPALLVRNDIWKEVGEPLVRFPEAA